MNVTLTNDSGCNVSAWNDPIEVPSPDQFRRFVPSGTVQWHVTWPGGEMRAVARAGDGDVITLLVCGRLAPVA